MNVTKHYKLLKTKNTLTDDELEMVSAAGVAELIMDETLLIISDLSQEVNTQWNT